MEHGIVLQPVDKDFKLLIFFADYYKKNYTSKYKSDLTQSVPTYVLTCNAVFPFLTESIAFARSVLEYCLYRFHSEGLLPDIEFLKFFFVYILLAVEIFT